MARAKITAQTFSFHTLTERAMISRKVISSLETTPSSLLKFAMNAQK
jgi:hypothetical protein